MMVAPESAVLVKIIGLPSRYHFFQGACPESQSDSRMCLSRSVSIGCQKPSWRYAAQLPDCGQLLHRAPLPDRVVAVDQVDHLAVEHEKAAVDPGAIAARLFLEARHPRAVGMQGEGAEAAWRLYGCHGRERLLLAVKRDQRA